MDWGKNPEVERKVDEAIELLKLKKSSDSIFCQDLLPVNLSLFFLTCCRTQLQIHQHVTK